MRYTEPRFQEDPVAVGVFNTGDTVTVTFVYDLETGATLSIANAVATELGTTGFFRWPLSNLTAPITAFAQCLVIMQNTAGLRVAQKVVTGGFPSDSAIRRYDDQVHIDAASSNQLTDVGSLTGTPNVTFDQIAAANDEIRRDVGSWVTDGFAVGQRVYVPTGTASNNGLVVGKVVAISTTTNPDDTLEFAGDVLTDEGPVALAAGNIVGRDFEFPLGVKDRALNNVVDARITADELGLAEYHVINGSAITIDSPHDNWTFLGGEPDSDIITFAAGNTVQGAQFDTIGVRGDLNGRVGMTNSTIGQVGGTVTGLDGIFADCGFRGTIRIAPAGIFNGLRVASRDLLGVTVDFDGQANSQFLAGAVLGVWSAVNMTQATNVLGLALNGSRWTLAASNTAGLVEIGGVGELTNNGAFTSFTDNVSRGSRIDAVFTSLWDQLLSAHTTTGSAGQALTELLNAIASRAVVNIGNGTTDTWTEDRYVYASGSPGDSVVHERFELYDQTGAAITGDANSGNNPLAAFGVMIAERRRI